MRILTDENVPGTSVHRLREAGYEVEWVPQCEPGVPDVGSSHMLGTKRKRC